MTLVTTDIMLAAASLKSGGIIAYPTEAVFGLGCDPRNDMALSQLLALKQRPAHKGLIVVAAEWAQLLPYLAAISPTEYAQVMATWPGPVTWVMPVAEGVSRLLTGEHESLAVRISAHPLIQMLCRAFGGAVVSTSANRSTEPPCKTTAEVRACFREGLDVIVAGQTSGLAKPTSIYTLTSKTIIRS